MSRLRALPVLMYHSIAPPGTLAPHGWLERISESVDLFAATLEDWDRHGIRTVGSDDIRSYLGGRASLGRGRVALTFDDGYLDNWVALAPLLRRHGQKAIVFVSTDFIDPEPGLRPTLDDTASPTQWQGYLSAAEMRAMSDSGAVEIQSHAMSHTWEFISPEIIDFYGPHWNIEHPRCRYRFLWLNRNKARKPFALRHLHRESVPWGTPVYRFAPALVARRYHPDPHVEERLVEHVATGGGEAFFQRPQWRQELESLVEDHRRSYGEKGMAESEEQRLQRVRGELSGSRERLEAITGRPVRFLSPPQGGAGPETLELARECGYDLVTAPSGGRLTLNRPGAGLGWIYRCGTGYDLFGRNSSPSTSRRSQRIVMARCSGSMTAALCTRSVGAIRRLLG